MRLSHVDEARVGLGWPYRRSGPVSLPAIHRIRRPAEFRSVLARGSRVSNSYMNVVATSNNRSRSRIGLSVSKRVGSAVTRNLIKRRIQTAFANICNGGGWDLVVIAKPPSSSVSYGELYAGIENLITRLGIEHTSLEQEVVAQ